MVSEILKEMEENFRQMEDLIRNQKFQIVDAQKYMERYFNIYRAMEDLIVSRDGWKLKYMNLKNGS